MPELPELRPELGETVLYSHVKRLGATSIASLLALVLVSTPLSASAATRSPWRPAPTSSAQVEYERAVRAYDDARQTYAEAASRLYWSRVSISNVAVDRYDNLLARIEPLQASAETALADGHKQLEARQEEKAGAQDALAAAKKGAEEATNNRVEAEKIQQGNRDILAQIEEQIADPANKEAAAKKSLKLARESVVLQLELSSKKKEVAGLKSKLDEARKALERLRNGESDNAQPDEPTTPTPGATTPDPSIPAPPPLPSAPATPDATPTLTPEQKIEALQADIAKLEADIPVADKELSELEVKAQEALDRIDAANIVLRSFDAPDAYKQMMIRRIAEKEELLKQFHDAEDKARAELASAERKAADIDQDIARLEAAAAQAQARVDYYKGIAQQIQERRDAAAKRIEQNATILEEYRQAHRALAVARDNLDEARRRLIHSRFVGRPMWGCGCSHFWGGVVAIVL